MAADTPPADLIDKLAAIYGETAECPSESPCHWCKQVVADMATALSEWADGALIDPATWTRWDRVQVSRSEPNSWGKTRPLYTLTKREDD